MGLLFNLVLMLVGCGYNIDDWPKISFPFGSDTLVRITINYQEQLYSKTSNRTEEEYLITDEYDLSMIYKDCQSFAYMSEEKTRIDTEEFERRVALIFLYFSEGSIKEYKLTYYGYGLARGYIVFNDGKIHYLPKNFAEMIYKYL